MAKKQNKQQRLEELSEQVCEIVGFGAVVEYGSKLTSDEVDLISEYCSYLGGNKDHVSKVLKGRGRPFTMFDPTFKRDCTLCHARVNYCCC